MLNAKGVESNEYLEYKGRPLVRHDDEIYYGDLSDKFYVFMMILSYKKLNDEKGEIPERIMIQLLNSQTKIPEKQSIQIGLTEAFEFANAWLDRYNK